MTETISIQLPHSLLERLDSATDDRSEFVREAIESKLRRVHPKGTSVWDALHRTAGLDVEVPTFSDKVVPVKL